MLLLIKVTPMASDMARWKNINMNMDDRTNTIQKNPALSKSFLRERAAVFIIVKILSIHWR